MAAMLARGLAAVAAGASVLTVLAALTIDCDAPDWMVFAPLLAAVVATAGAVASAVLPRRFDARVGDSRAADLIASVGVGLLCGIPVGALLFLVVAVAGLKRCSA